MAKRFVIQKLSKICEPGEIYPREYPVGEYIVSDEPGDNHITPHAADVAKREGWGGPLARRSRSSTNPELDLTGKGGSDTNPDDKDKKAFGRPEREGLGHHGDEQGLPGHPDRPGEEGGDGWPELARAAVRNHRSRAKRPRSPGSNDSDNKSASSSSTKAGG